MLIKTVAFPFNSVKPSHAINHVDTK